MILETEEDFIKLFPDDKTAKEFVIKTMNDIGANVCPRCGCDKYYTLKTKEIYKCSNNKCYHKRGIFGNTPFKNMKTQMNKYLYLLFLFIKNKDVSTYELTAKSGITQKGTWIFKKKYEYVLSDFIRTGNLCEDFNMAVKKILLTNEFKTQKDFYPSTNLPYNKRKIS